MPSASGAPSWLQGFLSLHPAEPLLVVLPGEGVAARGTGICLALVTRFLDWGQRLHNSGRPGACRPSTALGARLSDLPPHLVCRQR